MSLRPSTVLTSVTAVSALGLLAGAALPVQAEEPSHYVALGDSFSAGTGTRAEVDDCYRSPHGFPALLADAHGLQLDYQACSGAETADVRRDQLGALSPATDYVTITIGGNDLGYASVITQCALPGWLSNCQGRINDALALLHSQMPQRYDALFAEIAARAPAADVVIGNYPHLFNGRDCNLATFFSAAEMRALNGATDQLADVIAERTQAAGFRSVDARPAFQGHAVCDSPEWVNGLSWPIQESYHPNRDGNIGYADIFWPGTSDTAPTSTTGSATDSRGASTGEATVSRAQQVRAQADAVLAMDLTGSTNLRLARAEGVPTGELTRLVAQLRSDDLATLEQALAGLAALDEQHATRAGR
ncbi:SGNH/GDSL hydrolase family protein [Ornithinimicrobium sufpigmenti]|uniref:SGNH/GDSL hydrolase family protein n=1 Tax=Ornithinimicrobium sufpigmenti TaxID=2508882 RepID=UPI00103636E2|nr:MULTISPECIES: SGNH/GDSL hydrolase family protein [unclassified Ornithinimicrobium]